MLPYSWYGITRRSATSAPDVFLQSHSARVPAHCPSDVGHKWAYIPPVGSAPTSLRIEADRELQGAADFPSFPEHPALLGSVFAETGLTVEILNRLPHSSSNPYVSPTLSLLSSHSYPDQASFRSSNETTHKRRAKSTRSRRIQFS